MSWEYTPPPSEEYLEEIIGRYQQTLRPARSRVFTTGEEYAHFPHPKLLQRLRVATCLANLDFHALTMKIVMSEEEKITKFRSVNGILLREDRLRVERFNAIAEADICVPANSFVQVDDIEQLKDADDNEINWINVSRAGTNMYATQLGYDVMTLANFADRQSEPRSYRGSSH